MSTNIHNMTLLYILLMGVLMAMALAFIGCAPAVQRDCYHQAASSVTYHEDGSFITFFGPAERISCK